MTSNTFGQSIRNVLDRPSTTSNEQRATSRASAPGLACPPPIEPPDPPFEHHCCSRPPPSPRLRPAISLAASPAACCSRLHSQPCHAPCADNDLVLRPSGSLPSLLSRRYLSMMRLTRAGISASSQGCLTSPHHPPRRWPVCPYASARCDGRCCCCDKTPSPVASPSHTLPPDPNFSSFSSSFPRFSHASFATGP